MEDWPSRVIGEVTIADLTLGVRRRMSSVLGTEKNRLRREAFREMMRKRSCNRRMLVLYDGKTMVMEKSSTYEAIRPLGMGK